MTMIAWREMYMWFLLPTLMIGFIAYLGWVSTKIPAETLALGEASPSPTPQVIEAVSIPAPVVNPVLHIDVPQKSLFAP